MDKVMACPFCGINPNVSENEYGDKYCYCQDCNITFPMWHWETRVPDNQFRAENERLRVALESVEWVFDYDTQKEYCPWCMPSPYSDEGKEWDYPSPWGNVTHADDCPHQVALYGENWKEKE